jgi:hypothetical protein
MYTKQQGHFSLETTLDYDWYPAIRQLLLLRQQGIKSYRGCYAFDSEDFWEDVDISNGDKANQILKDVYARDGIGRKTQPVPVPVTWLAANLPADAPKWLKNAMSTNWVAETRKKYPFIRGMAIKKARTKTRPPLDVYWVDAQFSDKETPAPRKVRNVVVESWDDGGKRKPWTLMYYDGGISSHTPQGNFNQNGGAGWIDSGSNGWLPNDLPHPFELPGEATMGNWTSR